MSVDLAYKKVSSISEARWTEMVVSCGQTTGCLSGPSSNLCIEHFVNPDRLWITSLCNNSGYSTSNSTDYFKTWRPWVKWRRYYQPESYKFEILRWLITIHVWLHHKNLNACFSKTIIVNLLKVVSVYKVFVYLSSPANRSAQLLVKRELEIQGVWRNTKRVPTSTTLNFRIATI